MQGLWAGMIAGAGMQTLLLLIVLYKTNWTNEVGVVDVCKPGFMQ